MTETELPAGVHAFAVDRLAATPWRNGGGATREAVRIPAGAAFDAFHWRVSMADVAVDGPFSAFPGVERTIMLLHGPGVRLTGPGVDHVLDAVGAPFAFPGDVPLHSAVLGGPSRDFNVMTRRDRCHAEVRVVDEAADLVPCPDGLVMAVRGRWSLTLPGAAPTVDADAGVWWAARPGLPVAVRPVAADRIRPLLVCVRIVPVGPHGG